ncbi:ribonuclease BN (tRNA processing enzyme) [Caldalkalibacillus uzonensis]|uniref:Ribonuclease BN (tRNA processing enzyme) n=1 Tax=Caldalkalibacillus uzonensis TaxID=353224 RepID=A0ABU0CN80_9BACI|nr:MBL fold metallo-hydrolase [Caldalkalibacillus uzonensis]MDQ0337339.1 ribonuclease BN (tRNA processing enzyme) [Caldalkalibacillus uzonensis]
MKLTVIGCYSPFPKAGEATPGYLFEDHTGTKLLFDCGSGVASHIHKWINPKEVDAIILSHYHHDHVADVGVFQYAAYMALLNGSRSGPLTIYGPSLPPDKAEIRTYKDISVAKDIGQGQDIELGSCRFRFFQTDHQGPCYGWHVTDGRSSLVYGADSGPDTDWDHVPLRPDVLILESSFLEQNKRTGVKHLSAKEAALIAARLEAKHLVLTHFYPEVDPYQYVQEAKAFFSGKISAALMGFHLSLS